jgi:hypothetical protein
MSVRDTRLMERALRERWPIKPEYREKIIASLLLIVADRTASPRERTSAAKALLHADQINLEEERLIQEDEHQQRGRLVDFAKHLGAEELARLASASGISIPAIEAQDGRADSPANYDGEEAGG